MSQQPLFTTPIYIPAYTANNQALLITYDLSATSQTKRSLETHGPLAEALTRALHRAIDILCNLNTAWRPLHYFAYHLSCKHTHFIVKDTRSAGLSLVIALFNLHRQQHLKPPINTLVGTGMLRNDGTIEASHQEALKKTAISPFQHKQLITSSTCAHVFEVAQFMEK